jgi:hypothetical protein
LLNYGSSGSEVKKALNDLPTLYPEGVEVTDAPSADGGIIYTIKFSPERGI